VQDCFGAYSNQEISMIEAANSSTLRSSHKEDMNDKYSLQIAGVTSYWHRQESGKILLPSNILMR
jgi:hypothetical protein